VLKFNKPFLQCVFVFQCVFVHWKHKKYKKMPNKAARKTTLFKVEPSHKRKMLAYGHLVFGIFCVWHFFVFFLRKGAAPSTTPLTKCPYAKNVRLREGSTLN
jgi:hypothetical protein